MRCRPALVARSLIPLAALSAFALAQARTVEIVSAERLELRKVDGQDLVVISGDPVELHIDNDVIKARRVEFNRSRRVLTLVGAGSYLSHPLGADGTPTEQLVTGQNIVVDLGSENLAGEDVIVSTAGLEIRGAAVDRVPGQLSVQSGYFTPCARCGRTPNDYAFRAREIRLYPGDRLVAFDATLLLADTPVAFLPAIVLFLREPDRQPQFNFAQDSVDGFTVKASLPFVIGSSAFGNTLVHYYERRDKQLGFGVNLTAYQAFPTLDRLALYAMLEPQTLGGVGYDLDLKLDARGNVPVAGSLRGLDYSVTANRADTTAATTGKGVTNLDARAGVDFGSFAVSAQYLDRLGPPPSGPLYSPLKRPEVIIDPKPFTVGSLSADFRVTAGNYTGQVNPASRTYGIPFADENGNLTASRVQENHILSYTAQPWSGASFSVSNTFTGNYYSTGARVVDLRFGVGLTQNFNLGWGGPGNVGQGSSVGLRYDYTRQEGVSPFYNLDQSFARTNLSALLTGNATLVPLVGVSLTASQGFDFTKPARYDFNKDPSQNQPAASFGLNVNRAPLSLNLSYQPNFFSGLAQGGTGSLGLGNAGGGLYFSASTSYIPSLGFNPLQLSLSYTDFLLRTNSVSVGANYNFQYGGFESASLKFSAAATRDPVLNPVSFTLSQTLYYGFPARSPQFPARTPRLDGSLNLTWRDLAFSESHSLPLAQLAPPPGVTIPEQLGSATFTLSNVPGGPTSWSLSYGGPYSVLRGGFTTPSLRARYQTTANLQSFGADATVSMPGLEQPITELTNANVSSNYQFSSRVALGGALHFNRTRSQNTTFDTLNFDSLSLTFGLGKNERPDLYVTTILRQTLQWQNGVASAPQPLTPIVRLTVDRCCWAFNFEFNPLNRYIRFALQFPGSGFTPGLNLSDAGPAVTGLNTLP